MPSLMKGMPSPTKVLAHPSTSPPKTTARRDPFHLDDPQYDEERLPQYVELSKQCLDSTATKAAEQKARRKLENEQWALQQKAKAAREAAEKAHQKKLRKAELERISARVQDSKRADTQREKDIVEKCRKEMAAMRATQSEWETREQAARQNEKEYYIMEITRSKQADAETGELAMKKKAEREASAAVIQKQIRAKIEAQEKAAKALAKRSKAELATESKKQADTEAKKLLERQKEGTSGRAANIHYAKTHADRLHWEPPPGPFQIAQYAKEIRERTESPTGKS